MTTPGPSFLDQLGLDTAARKVELTVWRRPIEVRLVDGRLVAGRLGDKVSVGSNQTGMLARFARLSDAEDQAILAFAEQWGLLGLCRHGLPWADQHHRDALPEGDTSCTHEPGQTSADVAGEPTDGWRQMAAQAAAILQITDRIKRRRPAPPELWNPLRPLYPTGLRLPADPPPRGRPVAAADLPERGLIGPIQLVIPSLLEARHAIAYAIRRWLDHGDVRLRFDWRATTPQLTFGGASLLGALATLMAVPVGSAEGPLLCSHCRLPYTPTRRPRGPRHFCDDCRNAGVPQMYASRDYRARTAERTSPDPT